MRYMSANSGFSVWIAFDTTINYNNHGEMIGYSTQCLSDKVQNYNVDGEYIGYTKDGFAGIKHSFSADGEYIGTYRQIGKELWEKIQNEDN